MHVQWQIGEGECCAVLLQEGPKEGIVVSFARPSLEQWEMDVVVGASGEYVCMCLCCAFKAVGA